MAVSLVSTGVQFPNGTIQTTAATASAMTLISTTSITSTTTTITNCFSSTYNKYRILILVWDTGNSPIYPYFRMCNSAANLDTNTAYNAQWVRGQGATVAASNNGQNSGLYICATTASFGSAKNNALQVIIDVDTTLNTAGDGYVLKFTSTLSGNTLSGGQIITGAGNYVGSSGYSSVITGIGMLLQNSSGGASGTIKVYGLT